MIIYSQETDDGIREKFPHLILSLMHLLLNLAIKIVTKSDQDQINGCYERQRFILCSIYFG